MLKLKRRALLFASAAGLAGAGLPRAGRAQDAADALKSSLTPLGGERAGNADGSIPAWTGGYADMPPGYQPGDPRPVPFADEKPVLSITAANAAQYAGQLPAGAMHLFSLFANYRIDVYPTHRTAIAPQYVYDFTYKNASAGQISPDGNSISNVYGGTPFPIPTNGHQVVWNHLLAWRGTTIEDNSINFTAESDGEVVFGARIKEYNTYPYYYPDGEASFDGYYFKFTTLLLAPANQAGGATLSMRPINQTQLPPKSFQYLVGQRRTREAPQLQYDTPDYFTNGIGDFDEFQIFDGPLDEYDFKLLGKKEIYVPYNNNKSFGTPANTQLLGSFYNPDILRWEKHRVWVVEMTVAAGKRNVDARRVLYVDEDTWSALMCDIYDSTGALWKFSFSLAYVMPDIPCVLGSVTTIQHDFHAGAYVASQIFDPTVPTPWKPIQRLPESYWTPGQLAALAGGF